MNLLLSTQIATQCPAVLTYRVVRAELDRRQRRKERLSSRLCSLCFLLFDRIFSKQSTTCRAVALSEGGSAINYQLLECIIFDFVPLTVKAVHRTPFCSDCCVPDNAFPSLLNSQSMRDVTIAPSGPVATPSSVVVVLSKVAVRAQVHPSLENPDTV